MVLTTAEEAVVCFVVGSFTFFLGCFVRSKWKATAQRHRMMRAEEEEELCAHDVTFVSIQEQSPRNQQLATPSKQAREKSALAKLRESMAGEVPQLARPLPCPLSPVSPNTNADASLTFHLEESGPTHEQIPAKPAEESIVILQESVALTAENSISSEEEAERMQIFDAYEGVAQRVTAALRRLQMPLGNLGYLGATLSSALCAEVEEVIEDVPLCAGDVVVGVETPAGAVDVVGWQQLCVALGPMGRVFGGTEVTLKLIRNEDLITKWKEAVRGVEAGGTLPHGVLPDDEVTHVTMQLPAVSKRVLHTEFLIGLTDEAKCLAVVETLFDEFKNKSNVVIRNAFFALHRRLEETLGLQHVYAEDLATHFEEADITGSSSLTAAELYPVAKWLFLDALHRIVYGAGHSGQPAAPRT